MDPDATAGDSKTQLHAAAATSNAGQRANRGGAQRRTDAAANPGTTWRARSGHQRADRATSAGPYSDVAALSARRAEVSTVS
jgi:hypothetical protein